MKQMDPSTIRAINQALLFSSNQQYAQPDIRPWQYVQMEYERVGVTPPASTPVFQSIDDAQIWMCLDRNYNTRLREMTWPIAG